MSNPLVQLLVVIIITLLVAIGVLAIIAVMAWHGLDSLTRTRESLNHELEQARSLQLTLAQWQIDNLHYQ